MCKTQTYKWLGNIVIIPMNFTKFRNKIHMINKYSKSVPEMMILIVKGKQIQIVNHIENKFKNSNKEKRKQN